jgi:hypothetical protein
MASAGILMLFCFPPKFCSEKQLQLIFKLLYFFVYFTSFFLVHNEAICFFDRNSDAVASLNFFILHRFFLLHTAKIGQGFIWVQMVFFTTSMTLLLKTNLNFVLTPMKRRVLITNTTLVITNTT